MVIYTKNFHPDIDKKLVCGCGSEYCDKRSVNQFTLDRLQRVRDDADRPLRVTSGGRCHNHPNERHRKVPADHQLCQGVDVAYNCGIEMGELVRLAIKHGFNAIGAGKGFVHMGHREELPIGVIVMWPY